MSVSPVMRRNVVAALRGGAVPSKGLHLLATGLSRFEPIIDDELDQCATGRSVVKAVRADYGGGKTFFSRWIQARGIDRGFAAAEVQISANDTPLHEFETVYRRAMERLATAECDAAAFRSIIDGWLYTLEQELVSAGRLHRGASEAEVGRAVSAELENRLRAISAQNPHFAAVLKAYHHALLRHDEGTASGLIAWLSGAPGIAATIKAHARVTGHVDARLALNFLHGVVVVLRQTGRKGLILVLDEVETIQRQRADVREKSLNGLRQLIDALLGGQIPNVYLVVTGTPPFFEGPHGVRRLEPLHQRLRADFGSNPGLDNLRDIQVRLSSFDESRLLEVGRKLRELYPARDLGDLNARVKDPVVHALAKKVLGALGGEVGVAPRLFLKKLVGLLDRVNDIPTFDPAKDFDLKIDPSELSEEERAAAGVSLPPMALRGSPDDVKLTLDDD